MTNNYEVKTSGCLTIAGVLLIVLGLALAAIAIVL